jgi:molybdopterin-guanine dinucleotide biosynthesis protein A
MDQFESEGPIAALVSCHQHLNKPLLILACDMPAVTATMMDSLINLHKPELMTTMFCTPEKGLYEPMLSIWQETALDALAAFFLSGGRSFQTYLSSCNIPKNPLPSASTLMNCNTPEDWQKWKLNAF